MFCAEGYYCEKQEVLPGRCNLLIRMNERLERNQSFCFQTHSDVVDVKEMKDAFSPKIREGKLGDEGAVTPRAAVRNAFW